MAIIASLLYGDYIFHAPLEKGKAITFGCHKKDTVQIESMVANQVQVKWNSSDTISIRTKKPFQYKNDNASRDSMIVIDATSRAALYLNTLVGRAKQSIKLPYNCIMKVGRSESNNICIKYPFVARKQMVIRSDNGVIRVEDQGSTNGTFLNGRRITSARIKSGDVLSVFGAQIQLINAELFFDNMGNHLMLSDIDTDPAFQGGAAVHDYIGERKYHRSPRTQEQLPNEDIVLASAPSKAQRFEKGRGMLASLIGSGSMLAVSAVTAVASPALLAARAASMISPAVSAVSSSGGNKKRKKRLEEYEAQRREKYGAYIEEQKARIEAVANIQREILTRENPSPTDCADITINLRRNLWERTRGDKDFLDVRLGMGYEELCVQVKNRGDGAGFQMEDDDTRDLAEQIIEETRIVDNVPARLSLLKYNTIGIVGDRRRMIKLVKNMLTALATTHCFEDVRIVGIFDEAERAQWNALRWLPHIWDSGKQFRYLAFDPQDTHKLCELFNETLKEREREAKDRGAYNEVIPAPYYVFLIGSKRCIEREEIMNHLCANDSSLGVTSLFLYDELYALPHSCQFIIDVNGDANAYVRNEVNRKFYFTIDSDMTDGQFDAFARAMSAIELDGLTSAEGLPDGISFLGGYSAETVADLHVADRWQRSMPFKSLSAPIGVMNGGKAFCLDIHEKAHGPHGLVAGTTGSGKSELLQTWILSMAVNFHPYDVAFVIIDYKGGGMANLLEPLPHVVGKITNIGSNINRSLVSLQSETKRRQRIFDQYDVNHIDKYQKLYREGRATEPLPHLVIVADEFAELKKAEPEFMAGLVSVARVGRSLGIHLVLATQKPSGVVDDQIWSNSRFKLCLKVQDVSDSREMLKKPDAARITQAGRAYIQVGLDEIYELFQSYWSGAPYFGARPKAEDLGNPVRIVSDNGQRIKIATDEKTRSKVDIDELTAIIRHICSIAKENGIERLNGPWLPELPESLALDSILEDGAFRGAGWPTSQKWLTVPVGLFDAPTLQQQGTQFLDFAEEGHYGVYGAPSTGKTTFLKTVLLSLCLHYTPNDLNIYVLDFGGWGMSVFKAMPHIGGIVLDAEEEKIKKFEALISDEFDRRKRIFLQNSVSSLSAYRESVGDDIPAIIVAIDNITPIFDLYPDMESLFVTIAREGAAYGIYMIYTANGTSGVRYKIQQNIRGAVAFELTDKGDYASIVGRLEGHALPKNIGRAFFKGKPPVVFQAAIYCDGENEVQRTARLQEIIASMNQVWTGPRAKPIPVMPEAVSPRELSAEYTVRTSIPLGISYETVAPFHLNLQDQYCMAISGTLRSGKSSTLVHIAKMIACKETDALIYVFDSSGVALSDLQESGAGYALCSDPETVGAALEEIVGHLNERKRAQNLARTEAPDNFDELAFIQGYPLICIFIDDLREFVELSTDESKNSMERICRMAQHLGVMVFAAGRVSDLSRYNEIESLTRVILSNQKGLALGGTPAMHSYFQNNLKYNEKNVELGEDNGLVYDNGSCVKVKLPDR